MTGPETHQLQAILRRESRSLLQYIAEAYPWTSAGGEPAIATLREMIRAEAAALTALGQFLVRRRIPLPYLGAFPGSFTTCNFIALEHLLPRLVEVQRRLVAELEADLPRITDAGARAQVGQLLAVKRKTLSALEQMQAPHAQPAGA
jgi:hypothetical protein